MVPMCRLAAPTAVLCCLLTLPVAGCRRGDDEERIRAVIEEARTAVVERDAAGVLDLVDEGYRDPEGRTKREVRSLLLYRILRNRRLTVSIVAPKVVVSGDTAAARVTVVATGSEGGGIFPDNATSREFDIRFARRGRGWKVVSATWGGGAGDDLE